MAGSEEVRVAVTSRPRGRRTGPTGRTGETGRRDRPGCRERSDDGRPAPTDAAALDAAACDALRRRLLDLAWFRYRVPRDPAEDVFQAAFAAFLEVRGSYGPMVDDRALLAGIFRNKCLEHIDRSVREQKRLRAYCASGDVLRENPWIRPSSPGEDRSVVDQIVRDEDRREIAEAIARLRPLAKELVTLMDREGLDRQELIRRLKLNKNTLDSRLHACRRELRTLLRKTGVRI
jgi:RNA polymerase sigma factor (sigma-70 family)